MRKLKTLIFPSLFLQLIISCTNSIKNDQKINFKYKSNQYVGEQACISCHKKEHSDWQGSHHDWAMKLPNDSTVLGDFNNTSFAADGESYFFYKKDTTYFVRTGLPGKEVDYPIVYTFGFTPLQQYLIKFPGGKYQTLRATWDTLNKRWFNQYAGQDIPPNDWLHWTQGGQRWNTMCAECHTTNLKKNYNQNKNNFNTTYARINVSCEACHGPAGAHMNWAAQEAPTGDPQVGVLGWERIEQFNQCAGCHARRVKLTEVMKPDVAFDDQFRLQTINTEYYHPDGQIQEEDYVFGSFTQSKMFHKNVRCTNCHNSHSMELVYQGNLLCLQCHEIKYNSKDHHFHNQGSQGTQCVECHMTGNIYMGNDFRRDHSFRVPRPDQSVKYDTPNACTGCHEDKSDQWAADWVVKWYGNKRTDHFSDYLIKASRPPYDQQIRKEVLQFINEMQYPAIARATALEYYSLQGDEADYSMLMSALEDSSALVRANALNKFQIFTLEQRANLALQHIKDTTRMVRIAAAQLIVELDIDQLPPQDRGPAMMARGELEAMLRANADFPLGRLQLGDYYFRQNNPQRAIKEYEMALKMDSLLTPVYTNLATGYSIVGDNAKALTTLENLLLLEPEYGRGYYLKGLLYHEMGNDEMAIADLEKSIYYDQMNFRAYYNLANLYLSSGNLEKADQIMKTGLKIQPDSEDGKYLYEIIRARKSSE
jgi:tetratricopeptide (TPR) repeat protein